MADKPVRMDPFTRHVRALPGEFWLLREAAAILGVSVPRLRNMGRRNPTRLGAGCTDKVGNVRIYLYDQDDIDRIRAYFVERARVHPNDPYRYGRGRQPMWTTAEQAERVRVGVNARYHRNRAEALRRSDPARAARHAKRAAHLSGKLHAQYDKRKERMRG